MTRVIPKTSLCPTTLADGSVAQPLHARDQEAFVTAAALASRTGIMASTRRLCCGRDAHRLRHRGRRLPARVQTERAALTPRPDLGAAAEPEVRARLGLG